MRKLPISEIVLAGVGGVLVATIGILQVWAQDSQINPQLPDAGAQQVTPQQPGHLQMKAEGTGRAMVITSMPSRKIVGASVVNPQGETVGSIDDLVIDLESGKITYTALSVGGVLGIGDKLFAVPFDAFHTTHDTNNHVSFVLDVSKERLENAPGFDKSHWPDFASPQWRSQIDNYYRQSSASRAANEGNRAEPR